ncbi:NAD(P)-dependent oxidoreductase [Hyphococcus sp.]|uniref:NAD(P)-dependent oxidoreductase n=1 Tax=Hyphococcus sp. TaxID=2038636 RepID=UPI0035C6D40A
MSGAPNICLIGFGEVGQILAEDLSAKSGALSAWDSLFCETDSAPSRAAGAVRKGDTAEDAARDADIIISAVTAAQTLHAAEDVVTAIKKNAVYLDLNSASPNVKSKAADLINKAGGKYVEASVMSPIGPKRIACPMLFGGPYAKDFLPAAYSLGFNGAQFFSSDYGKAAAAKMCRSIVVKGVEALLTESLLSARHYGVDETVVASLSDLFPGPDWEKLSAYMISRALEHGGRRAEEMREVAKTVKEAGLSPLMSSACAERQDLSAAHRYALDNKDLPDMLDAILNGRGPERPL